MWWFVFAGAWLAFGVPAYGLTLAYFQREYPDLAERDWWVDVMRATEALLLGPAGLLGTLLFLRINTRGGLRHGFMFWRSRP